MPKDEICGRDDDRNAEIRKRHQRDAYGAQQNAEQVCQFRVKHPFFHCLPPDMYMK